MSDDPPARPPPKRDFPFKRTAKRKPADKNHSISPSDPNKIDDDDSLSLFRRSRETFPTVLEEQRKQVAEKAARAEKERQEKLAQEKKYNKIKCHEDDDDDSDILCSIPKRRRTSDIDSPDAKLPMSPVDSKKTRSFSTSSDNKDSLLSPASRKQPASSSVTSRSPSASRPGSSKSPSRRRKTTPKSTLPTRISREGGRSTANVIALDDSDDDVKPIIAPSPSATPQRPKRSAKKGDAFEDSDLEVDPIENKEEEEDEFSSYIQSAIERTQKHEKEREARALAGPANGGGLAPNDASDPAVKILIDSRIPDLKPLIVQRKVWQPLAAVHKAWVSVMWKPGCRWSRETLEAMFFTWKGNKVYNSTTLETLGVRRPDASSGALWDREKARDGYKGTDQVYFEAWTQEAYDEHQRALERERREQEGEDDYLVGHGDLLEDVEEQAEKKFKIYMKARDYEKQGVSVRLSDRVDILIAAFRKMGGFESDRVIQMYFDGEALDPNSTIEDIGVEQGEMVEVHIQ